MNILPKGNVLSFPYVKQIISLFPFVWYINKIVEIETFYWFNDTLNTVELDLKQQKKKQFLYECVVLYTGYILTIT